MKIVSMLKKILNLSHIIKMIKFFLTNAYNKSKNTCALIGLRLNYQDMFIENPKNFIFYLMN